MWPFKTVEPPTPTRAEALKDLESFVAELDAVWERDGLDWAPALLNMLRDFSREAGAENPDHLAAAIAHFIRQPVKFTLLDFDTYNELDWSRYAVQLSESFTKDQARSEYFDRLDELIASLKRLGSHNAFGEGDFATGDDWYGPHRSLDIALTSDRLLTSKLVPTIQALIHSFPHPYMVTIGYDSFLNGSSSGLSSGDFYASIEADSVTITVHNELVLSLLGLRDAGNLG